MHNLTKLTLSLILIALIVLGLNSPVKAQVSPPTIYVDAPSSVTVSTEFDIIIWIRDIPAGWGLLTLSLGVEWDPNNLEYIECEFLGSSRPGWSGGCGSGNPGLGGGGGGDSRSFPVSRWTEDAAWFRFRFHCLREGPALITVFSIPEETVHLEDDSGTTVVVNPEPFEVTVEQGFGAVGGISTPINRLEIIAPYLALAGLIIAVSAIVIKRRK